MSFKRSVLITGATQGLGYEAALVIARSHPDYLVVMSARSDNGAAAAINKATGQSNAVFAAVDLADLQTVRALAKRWAAASRPPIQALLLNAGLQFPGALTLTKEGIEATFSVCHIGHALLFHVLFSHLADSARVVITSSGVHDPAQKWPMPRAVYESAEKLAHPDQNNDVKDGRERYTTAKLCNILWMYELVRRLGAATTARGITITALDPGLMPGTGLAREAAAPLRFVWGKVLPRILPVLRLLMSSNIHTTKESGEALARLAVGEDVEGQTGVYFEGLKPVPTSKDSHDKAKALDLWDWTVNYIAGGDEEEKSHFNDFQ